jgi:nitroimidazol reductase NimA-like FMN-containing flavoprotein (pyridoxamine 5'-phosphate oxidase superfamily)
MTTIPAPVFTELSDDEARQLLASHHVGRLAFSLHDRVDIQPVGYVYDDGWILGRTGAGTKLSTLLHHPWCAFEVDEIRSMYDWESVVVRGSFYILDPELGSSDRYDRALEVLGKVNPAMFTEEDPTPERGVVFGIYAQEMTGRSARAG